MSTRKSVNKQQNSESPISSSSEQQQQQQQQSQDAGSESIEPPTTPTNKMSSSQTNLTDSKRKRRTNSIPSISTPKRSTSETSESPIIDPEKTLIKEIKQENSTPPPPQTDSPRTRKKANEKSNITTVTTSTISTRKSAAAEAALKNAPTRTSLRSKNAKKNASPSETGTPKSGARTSRKKAEPASTPLKRERLNSNQSENEMDEKPDLKKVKIEKVEVEEEEPEEEILMEIRTEILDELKAKEEVKVIEIKDENLDSEVDLKESHIEDEVKETCDESTPASENLDNNSSVDSTKENEVQIVDTPAKVVSLVDHDEIKTKVENENHKIENHIPEEDKVLKKEEDTAKDKEDSSSSTTQKDDNTEPDENEEKKEIDSKKKEKVVNVEPEKKRLTRRKPSILVTTPSKKGSTVKKDADPQKPARRARVQRAAAAAALTKTLSKTKKVVKSTENTNNKPSTKSPVPENTDESDTTKPQVPESIEDDELNNSTKVELIFSTTTNPTNRDKLDQSHEPLLIDTTTQNSEGKDSIPSTECTAGSEKSDSLSPVELESEGVSEVCVKEFYKEPQFLENNLGIEKDPKLGGIVQTVDIVDPKLDVMESTSLAELTSIDNSKETDNTAKTLDTTVNEKEFKMDTDEKEDNIVLVVNPVISNESIVTSSKTPEITEVNEESDLSDTIKEGELMLVLDDSTEEENSLSQKTDVEEVREEQLDAIIKEENVLMDSMEDDKPNNQEIHSETKNNVEIEPKNNQQDLTLPSEEIILTVHTVDKKDLNEDGNVTKPDLVSDLKVDLNESESKIETNQEKTEKEPEEISKIKCSTMETAEEDEDNEKDTIEKESTTMEIDSGVSDVAENNSTDPNEDLNLIHEIIGCAKQKIEISDSECSANAKAPSVSVEHKVVLEPAQKNLQILDITSVKPYISKDEKKDIPHITIKISETPETLKQKETHLKSLGLLTIKAADEAKIEKQKRRQQLNVSTPSTSKKVNGTANTTSDSSSGSSCSSNSSTSSTSSSSSEPNTSNGNGSNASGSNDNSSKSGQEYTGTLKTVIKLNRPTGTPIQSSDKKKHHHSNGNSNGQSSVTANSMALVPVTNTNVSGRMPLKITLQKGRGRGTHLERHANGSHHSSEHAYYTIQNEAEAGTQDNVTHGRKSHHYRINIDQTAASETSTADKAEVLIPEKASSFAIHPGRLCQDQCFYCGGKFGLYDTPCHVAQLKSAERQKKILENEEKLTVDNCLCDACFRHLDRRANAAAAQKKRLSAPANIESHGGEHVEGGANSSIEGNDTMPLPHGHSLAKSVCFVTNCGQRASHTFRRKGFRKTIKKLLGDDIDLTNMGGRLPICDKHYEIIIQCLECALCKRRLIKNHMHHITQDVQLLESLLVKQGIPVKLQANPAVCKLCRYFTNLLIKPPEGRTQKAQFVKNYRRRLLHFHNIQQSDEGSEVEGQEDTLEKSKSPSPVKRGRKPKKLSQSQTSQNQMQRTSGTSEDGISDEIVDLDPDPVQSTPTAGSGQMQLDNDVMVDYDLPVLCDTPSPPATSKSSSQPQQASKLQAILQSGGRSNDDISLVLRSNPNISMRELFPGEEDLGLQVNVPFGSSSSQRTPEGWTRIQTFLQYDEPTRRLWEDLQKPYGNQSSFLRHLILLEKYFRNGDLILSQNASTTATAYSETVQNRLHSYDYSVSSPQTATNKNNSTATSTITSRNNTNKLQQQQQQQQPQKLQINPSLNTNNISSPNGNIGSNNMVGNNNLLMSSVPDPIKKLHSNLTITITPKTRLIPDTAPVTTSLPIASSTPTTTCTTTSSGNSILKSNLLSRKNSAIEIIPISSGSSNTEINSRPVMTSLTKQQKLLAAANQLMGEEKSSNSINSPLTSMSIGASQNHQPKHHNLPPELISLNRNNPNSLLIGSRNMFGGANTSLKSKTHSNMHLQTHSQLPSHRPRIAPTIIKLPGTLAPHERMASKHWRPTLMPINTGPLRSAPGVLYQTADGRKLPSLVQVQSGGKPYLISIHDYNRMCILRREKLMRDQMMKNGKVSGSTSSMNSGGNSLLKGALSSNSGINSSSSSSTNSPSVSSVVSLSNSVSKSILSQGNKQW